MDWNNHGRTERKTPQVKWTLLWTPMALSHSVLPQCPVSLLDIKIKFPQIPTLDIPVPIKLCRINTWPADTWSQEICSRQTPIITSLSLRLPFPDKTLAKSPFEENSNIVPQLIVRKWTASECKTWLSWTSTESHSSHNFTICSKNPKNTSRGNQGRCLYDFGLIFQSISVFLWRYISQLVLWILQKVGKIKKKKGRYCMLSTQCLNGNDRVVYQNNKEQKERQCWWLTKHVDLTPPPISPRLYLLSNCAAVGRFFQSQLFAAAYMLLDWSCLTSDL